jgi:uncharacterized Zn finger protein
MRKVLAKVDDGRFGRAVAGLVTRALVVKEITHREKEVCAVVVSYGKMGTREFGVCIRGQQVFCSCRDFREHGVHCKHIVALALHEMGAAAQARSERSEVVELVGRRG